MVRIIVNILQRNISKSHKSEIWMRTEYDARGLDYWALANRKYIVKLKQNDGLGCETYLKNTMPAHLGSFILSKSKRKLNHSYVRIMVLRRIMFTILIRIFYVLRKSKGICWIKLDWLRKNMSR